MRRHSLKELERFYNPLTIQLVLGEHLVNIDTRVEGSAAVYRAFEDFKFDVYKWNEECKHLVLKY